MASLMEKETFDDCMLLGDSLTVEDIDEKIIQQNYIIPALTAELKESQINIEKLEKHYLESLRVNSIEELMKIINSKDDSDVGALILGLKKLKIKKFENLEYNAKLITTLEEELEQHEKSRSQIKDIIKKKKKVYELKCKIIIVLNNSIFESINYKLIYEKFLEAAASKLQGRMRGKAARQEVADIKASKEAAAAEAPAPAAEEKEEVVEEGKTMYGITIPPPPPPPVHNTITANDCPSSQQLCRLANEAMKVCESNNSSVGGGIKKRKKKKGIKTKRRGEKSKKKKSRVVGKKRRVGKKSKKKGNVSVKKSTKKKRRGGKRARTRRRSRV